jgi:hypothetical protein
MVSSRLYMILLLGHIILTTMDEDNGVNLGHGWISVCRGLRLCS